MLVIDKVEIPKDPLNCGATATTGAESLRGRERERERE